MPTNPLTMAAFVLLALLAGAAMAYQPGINAKFGEFAGSRVWGGVINFLVGLLAMSIVATAMRSPIPATSKLANGPVWMWVGGLCGAFFVTLALVLVPKMGAAAYLSTMIAGQLLASIVIDHFGHMGLPERHITPGRLAGVLLMAGGMVLIRKF